MQAPSAPDDGIEDVDISHVVANAMATGDQADGKVLYLGPDRSGTIVEVVSVLRDDETEIVIHAMRMHRTYESFLRDKGDTNG